VLDVDENFAKMVIFICYLNSAKCTLEALLVYTKWSKGVCISVL